jgi:hypothetical protein
MGWNWRPGSAPAIAPVNFTVRLIDIAAQVAAFVVGELVARPLVAIRRHATLATHFTSTGLRRLVRLQLLLLTLQSEHEIALRRCRG